MKGLCVYIKAGKGHYVPARAVNEQMEAVGVESQLVDFFDYLGQNRNPNGIIGRVENRILFGCCF